MRKLTDNRWVIRILALFFAILLFIIANGENLRRNNDVNPSTSLFQKKIENVPIEYKYDHDKYYLSGYEESTNVTLMSANKLLIDKEVEEQTRTFAVFVDLSKYKEGTYEVPLQLRNLNSALSASFSHKKVHVTLEKKATKKVSVTPIVNPKILKKGYELGEVSVSPKKVMLTSGEQTLKSVSDVKAVVTDMDNVDEDFKKNVTVYALDKEGNPLNVTIDPVTVEVSVKIKASAKKVPLKVVQEGSPPKDTIKSYKFEPKTKELMIYGQPKVLETINELKVVVDVSTISDKTQAYYAIRLPDNVKADIRNILVTVTPVYKDKPKEKTDKTDQTEKKDTSTSKSSSSSDSSQTDTKESSTDSTDDEETTTDSK